MPTITVIIPVYNVAEYLSDCIDSILSSTYKDIEVILIDDGSTDISGEICNSYEKKDHRIRVFHKKNEGVSSARNIGLEYASGKYVNFVDADDFVHPQMLEILLDIIQKSQCDVAICDYSCTNNRYHATFFDMYEDNLSYSVLYPEQALCGLFGSFNSDTIYQLSYNKLYKRKIMDSISFDDYKKSEDTLFNCRVFSKINGMAVVHAPLYYWYQRESSVTHQFFSMADIQTAEVYSHCLSSIPTVYSLAKNKCLEKMVKYLLNMRYRGRKTNYQKEVNGMFERYENSCIKDLFQESSIRPSMKYVLFCFMKFPFSYSLFQEINELRAKIAFKKIWK